MVDRFVVWVSAGVITAGMSAAMVAGAGLALAEDDGSSGSGAGSTSESSKSVDSRPNSDASGAPDGENTGDTATPEEPDVDGDGEEPADEEPAEEEPAEEEPAEEPAEPAEEPADDADNADNDGSDLKDKTATTPVVKTTGSQRVVTAEAESEKAVVEEVEATEQPVRPSPPVEEERATVAIDDVVADMATTPEVQAVAFASAPTAAVNVAATSPQIPGIIRVIGTIVFNLYAVATRLVGGPPILPAGSSVTVRSSSLTLNCGCDDEDTITVPADWYIPEAEEGAPPPDRLIYLQHGFLASGPWYSHTAAALAEQTNSIVVAPSITSNFLAADACWLGAAPMHEAIADLFAEGNPALANSALAAGYAGPIPDRVVLMGHSLGGGAVSGAAGFMSDDSSIDRLAGVVLLDGVGLNDKMADDLKKVPTAVPIYQLAAPRYFWNQFGVGTAALLDARPDAFIGVTLAGGSHVDAMRGGNPLIQFSQQLVSGFSTRQNVAAAEQLMVGWVTDMFAGNQATGIYLDRGEELILDTPAGETTVVDLPNSLTKPFIFNFLQSFVSMGNGIFTFEPTCVAASMGAASSCEEPIAA